MTQEILQQGAREMEPVPQPIRAIYPLDVVRNIEAVAEEMGIPFHVIAEQGSQYLDPLFRRELGGGFRVPLGKSIVSIGTGAEDLSGFWTNVLNKLVPQMSPGDNT